MNSYKSKIRTIESMASNGSGDSESDDEFSDALIDEVERAVEEAAKHVDDAKAQRNLVHAYKEIAVTSNTRENDVPHHERTYMFYFDYAQNVQCPQFGSEQPGETYYYSPLNINVFGIVDANTDTEQLQVYCFHEGHGAKGGNSVVSMLHHFLHTRNLLSGNGNHLVLVCDNCAGQNKNRMVI